jgi:hypothetical protein
MTDTGCLLCDPEQSAEALNREIAWEDPQAVIDRARAILSSEVQRGS